MWCPSSDISRRVITVVVNVAYISNVNVMKVGLKILLLVFRTSRILTETGLRLSLFLNLFDNCFNLRKTPCCMDSWLNNLLFYLPCLKLIYK